MSKFYNVTTVTALAESLGVYLVQKESIWPPTLSPRSYGCVYGLDSIDEISSTASVSLSAQGSEEEN